MSIEIAHCRHKGERQFRESERQLAVILKNVDDAVIATDKEGCVALVNPVAEALTGWKQNDALGQDSAKVFRIVDQETGTLAENPVTKVLLEGVETHLTDHTLLVAKDGTAIPVDVSAAPIRVGKENATGAVVVFRDSTERARAEEALRRYAERLEILRAIDQDILVAQSPEAIAQAALRRIRQLVSCQWASVVVVDFQSYEARVLATQHSRETMMGRQSLPRPPFQSPSLEVGGAQSSVNVPLTFRSQLVGFLNLGGNGSGALAPEGVAIAREVADSLAVAIQQARLLERIQRHAAELEQRVAEHTHELTEANERLKELDRLKSKFVSNASHELRTSVTNVRIYLHLLEHGTPENRPLYLTVLREQADRLETLIEDTLSLSRLEAGEVSVEYAPVELNEVVEQVVTACQPAAQSAGLELIFEADANLPPVWSERNQLSQVVTNLVANAINYTPTGQVRISTYLDADQGQACLQVQDTGMGIEAEDLAHIFDRFFRGQGLSSSSIPGTGLGLSIVKEIVNQHGGTVKVESQVGAGSTFRVWLPVEGCSYDGLSSPVGRA